MTVYNPMSPSGRSGPTFLEPVADMEDGLPFLSNRMLARITPLLWQS